jgi:hypothetical protein
MKGLIIMMEYNGYSIESIKKIYEIGKSCKSIEEIVNKMGNKGLDAIAIAEAGMKYGDSMTIEEKSWYRIGEPAVDIYGACYKNSYNFANDCPEDGVSVVTESWLNSLKSVFFGAHDNKELASKGIYEIKGVMIGFGGDDEPLIYPTDWAKKTRVKTFNGLKKLVKNA